ncbi:MAG: TIGR04283 family arsenosugar biosynthesis glycosyltransferase [Chitinophagaceae bacterium]|uniref:TIGR04283 family arsenosugar biosynthesis glycosyltransferase n=1 Tax=unclassified Paraflavitalea TaxID=2798305 RepID=UPI003D3552BD|nr:TIGR04283 family arsenosugar biosynthesis glycosyltransferase [Chitinophagaceae bacterium]
MISVVIPVYNEALSIGNLIHFLKENGSEELLEIIIVDAASTDSTVSTCKSLGVTVIQSAIKGRAAQLHLGAQTAKGDVLYFVHADTMPAKTFIKDIYDAVKEGYQIGRYRTKFDSSSWLLKINAWFTRFDWFICYGGDQTLFIKKDLYFKVGGFDVSLKIMEEYEFVERARRTARYKIFKGTALVSARKYSKNSWWKVQQANRKAVAMFRKGCSQESIFYFYKNALK